MIKQNWRGVPVGATYTEDRGEHGRISFDRSPSVRKTEERKRALVETGALENS